MYANETSLIKACLDDNQQAWAELVDRYANLVYSIALRYRHTRQDAEEIFQSVFIIIHRELPKLREHQALAGWIITITSREAIRFHKKNRSHYQAEAIEDEMFLPELGPGMPSIETVHLLERAHQVRLALKQLESPCLELLTILFWEDPTPSYDEVAERLGMPVGSIGPNRGRCLKRLETILSDWGVDLEI